MIALTPDNPQHLIHKINLQTFNRILKKTMRQAKETYYLSCFRKYKNDIRNTWATIKIAINKNKQTKTFPNNLNIGGTEVTDFKTIATKFNEFFVNIGPDLADSIIEPANTTFQMFLKLHGEGGITTSQTARWGRPENPRSRGGGGNYQAPKVGGGGEFQRGGI